MAYPGKTPDKAAAETFRSIAGSGEVSVDSKRASAATKLRNGAKRLGMGLSLAAVLVAGNANTGLTQAPSQDQKPTLGQSAGNLQTFTAELDDTEHQITWNPDTHTARLVEDPKSDNWKIVVYADQNHPAGNQRQVLDNDPTLGDGTGYAVLTSNGIGRYAVDGETMSFDKAVAAHPTASQDDTIEPEKPTVATPEHYKRFY